jgi:PAS domain-containing protein
MSRLKEHPMAQPAADFDFYRSILEDLHLAVYVVNRAGKIVFWNDGAERITGYLRQEVIGRTDNDNLLGETDGDDNDLSGPCAPTAVARGQARPGPPSLRQVRTPRPRGTLVLSNSQRRRRHRGRSRRKPSAKSPASTSGKTTST